jgi:hypothetical protein
MAKRPLPSPEALRQLFRYEPDTGKLFWKPRSEKMFACGDHGAKHNCFVWNSKYANKQAFTSIDSKGYRQTNLGGKVLRAHRVAWAVYFGEWPKHQIDHINGDRTDNRIVNLRDVEEPENKKNQKKFKDNKSGVSGVCWHKRSKKWVAQIASGKKYYYLGLFETKEEAAIARKAAEVKLGFHKNHGRSQK